MTGVGKPTHFNRINDQQKQYTLNIMYLYQFMYILKFNCGYRSMNMSSHKKLINVHYLVLTNIYQAGTQNLC